MSNEHWNETGVADVFDPCLEVPTKTDIKKL